ncbi:ABC transporter permease [Gracilinema caldarium]|uniref:ABC transporter permease n=1 Tax=Gracilinema caldarium TaxID=215591 RepID=UPI0026EF3F64|nr:ABC transporter permease [Gracilinema caldarium]
MRQRVRFFIALRYLLGRSPEGSRYLRGAALGIAISMIPIMVTLIVSDGMIQGITDRYLELGTGHLQVYAYGPAQEEVSLLIPHIQDIEGVSLISPERDGLGIVVGPNGKTGVTLRSVSHNYIEYPGTRQYLSLLSGELSLSGPRSCLIGTKVAESIGAKPGDTIRLMTVKNTNTGNMIPRITALTVSGIVSSGYRELDSLWCFIPYDLGRSILSSDTSKSFLVIKTKNPYKGLESTAAVIQERLGDTSGVYNWKELQATQYQSFESTRQMLLLIMAIIVLVAAVNVASATSMLVVERRREIAILKSYGAAPFDISLLFSLGAGITGFIGSAIGIALGLGIGYTINEIIHGLEFILSGISSLYHGDPVVILNPSYYLERIPIVVNWSVVGILFVITVLGSMIAALGGARQAGKLLPVEILQKY